MIVLLCSSEFYMIVLKAEQTARMQRWKDDEREANERMLVYDFFFFRLKDLCCSEFMIILLRYSEFNMIVLEADQVARMQRRKDEEREAKECMLVNDIIFFFVWIE
jgi:hypothetical protein